jgi:hypothetical protein
MDQQHAKISRAMDAGKGGDSGCISEAAAFNVSNDQEIVSIAQPAPSQINRCSNAIAAGIFLKNEFSVIMRGSSYPAD